MTGCCAKYNQKDTEMQQNSEIHTGFEAAIMVLDDLDAAHYTDGEPTLIFLSASFLP